MSHADILKIVLRFENIAPGQSATQDHRIKIKGVGQLPDHIHYDNGAFKDGIVADTTTVTVTNTSDTEASVDVLVEHWHSIPRVFGVEGQKSLVVRPYISGPGAGGVDELVKASPTDTTAGMLNTKLSEGDGIAFTLLNPGADESIEIEVENAGADEIETGDPVTVRGDTNAEGGGSAIARAEHQHRLEYEVEDEGVLVSARPRMDFVGDGVGAVDVPGQDKTQITIPGPNLGDGGAVVERSTYVAAAAATSGNVFVDGMAGLNVTVPIDGSYWAIWEGEFMNSNANAELEVGVSVNSVVAVVANSERITQGNANDRGSFVTTVELGALTAGDLVRGLFRKASGPQTVSVIRRNLSIFKVQ